MPGEMTETTFAQGWAGEGRSTPYSEAGSGETIVAIVGDGDLPTRAHALLAERRRVIVFAITADAEPPQEAARRIGAAVAALGIEHFDLMGEGAGAAAAVWLAVAPEADIGSVVLAAPASLPGGPPDEAFREIKRPVLVLSGTKDQSAAGDRYRTLLPDCHFMFVYDAGPAIGAERPEALAFIVLEFFERRDLFLVSRESGMAFP
jgi:pimeloyl-ACP methyl ester carboxylesterase